MTCRVKRTEVQGDMRSMGSVLAGLGCVTSGRSVCMHAACIQGSDTFCMFADSNLSKNGPWNELSKQTGDEPNAMNR